MERKIARWESIGWTFTLIPPSSSPVARSLYYRGDSSGGGIEASTEAEAITAMQARLDRGGFQPDAAKTPMRRVF